MQRPVKRSLYVVGLRPQAGRDYSQFRREIMNFPMMRSAGTDVWYFVSEEPMEEFRSSLEQLMPGKSADFIQELLVIPTVRELDEVGFLPETQPHMRAVFEELTA